MEHRHFPRKPVDVNVQLSTADGKFYQARLLELSAIGMRVEMIDRLSRQVKIVEVRLPDHNSKNTFTTPMRMFVARKHGRVLGLCLMNENAKIDMELCESQPAKYQMSAN